MGLAATYITREFTAYLDDDDIIRTDLFLAVELIDGLTKGEPSGRIRVWIKKSDTEPIRNPSGYYLFIIPRANIRKSEFIADEKYRVCIESDYYFYEEQEMKVADLKILPLEFDGSGPQKDAVNAKLKEVTGLSDGDLIEFSNPEGKKEKRSISEVNKDEKIIHWRLGLEYDYNMANSTIVAFIYPLKKFYLKPAFSYPFSERLTLVRGKVADIDPKAPPTVKVEGGMETTTDERGEFVLYLKGVGGKTINIVIMKGQMPPMKIPVDVKKDGDRISLGVISVR